MRRLTGKPQPHRQRYQLLLERLVKVPLERLGTFVLRRDQAMA